MVSGGYSISFQVPDRVKQDIWSDKFIELRSLLPEASLAPSPITLNVSATAGQQLITVAQEKGHPKELSILEWLTAFNIFMDIFLVKFPAQVFCRTLLRSWH
jgi:hypothetical protein